MNLFNLKETTERTGVSRATIYRFYEKNPELWNETLIKNKKRLIPEEHLTLITKTNIYAKHLALEQEHTQLKNLVDAITKDPFLYQLYLMGWDWFCTIAFKKDYNSRQSFHRMQQAVNHIIDCYGENTGINFFYTVEPFTNREGTHIHFVMKLDNPLLWKAVSTELKSYFKGNRIDIKPYDKYKAGIYYMAKHGLRGENWDFLGNNFKENKLKAVMSKY